MIRRVVVVVLLAVAALGVGSARARLVDIDTSGGGTKDLLYMPNGKYLKAISLGHAPLLADFVYLWAIQYYSDYNQVDRYRYVEHVFGEVIAEGEGKIVRPKHQHRPDGREHGTQIQRRVNHWQRPVAG